MDENGVVARIVVRSSVHLCAFYALSCTVDFYTSSSVHLFALYALSWVGGFSKAGTKRGSDDVNVFVNRRTSVGKFTFLQVCDRVTSIRSHQGGVTMPLPRVASISSSSSSTPVATHCGDPGPRSGVPQ
jgi:hypothetical protein